MKHAVIARKASLIGLLCTLCILFSFQGIGALIGGLRGLILGTAIYFVFRIGLRRLYAYHQSGIKNVQGGRFADAISDFRSSIEFFDRYPWIDRFRCIIILSPSAWGYREMGLANIGYCHAQLGDGNAAIAAYRRCLAAYPDSVLASTAIQMLKAGQSVSNTRQDDE